MITVYLDTSDFSRFADIGTPQEADNIRETYNILVNMVESDKVEVRYSMVHLTEILRYRAGLIELAIRKARIINKLCRGRCFIYPGDVWTNEVMSNVGNLEKAVGNCHIFSNENLWMPDIIDNLKDYKKQVTDEIKKEIAELANLSRSQRRQIMKQIWHRGRISDFAKQAADKHYKKASEELMKQFPLTERFYDEKMFLGFLSGAVKEHEIKKEFIKGLCNPEQFIEFYFEKYDPDRRVPGWISSFENTIHKIISDLRSQAKGLSSQEIKTGIDTINDTFLRRAAFRLAQGKLAPNKRDRDSKLTRIWKQIEGKNFGSFPSIDVLSKVAKVYAYEHSLTDRKLKYSDGGDILHLAYMPYSNVFRTDRYFASLIERSVPSRLTQIVNKVELLPAAIDHALAAS